MGQGPAREVTPGQRRCRRSGGTDLCSPRPSPHPSAPWFPPPLTPSVSLLYYLQVVPEASLVPCLDPGNMGIQRELRAPHPQPQT